MSTHTRHGNFLGQAGHIINGRLANVLLLTGNTQDVYSPRADDPYRSLTESLADAWSISSRIVIVAELNGPLRFVRDGDRDLVRAAWVQWRCGLREDPAIARLNNDRLDADISAAEADFEATLQAATGRPTLALEWLRQCCCCSRAALDQDLIIIVESVDLLIPDSAVAQQQEGDRHRLHVMVDWFLDPAFSHAQDVVVLVAEAASDIHQRITSLPHVRHVAVPQPDAHDRQSFIAAECAEAAPNHSDIAQQLPTTNLATASAGLSLLALRQLIRGAMYGNTLPTSAIINDAVAQHIKSRLGDDVVDFARPTHTLDDVVGFTALKDFLRSDVLPRLRMGGKAALSGAAVGGPIGAGKTFLFEACAAEVGMPVLVLKNIRSKWFGGTDVLLERLRGVLEALDRVVILVDEADTALGDLSQAAHATERRLIGKIQGLMSDPTLRGRVFWLLMTARVHRLSPDVRRPGRVGDLIIPVLDPEGDDRAAFIRWMLKPAQLDETTLDEVADKFQAAEFPTSAADFATVRAEIAAQMVLRDAALTADDMYAIVHDRLAPDIAATRRYQTLQALVNCTRRSLLPDQEGVEEQRAQWQEEIRQLELAGQQ